MYNSCTFSTGALSPLRKVGTSSRLSSITFSFSLESLRRLSAPHSNSNWIGVSLVDPKDLAREGEAPDSNRLSDALSDPLPKVESPLPESSPSSPGPPTGRGCSPIDLDIQWHDVEEQAKKQQGGMTLLAAVAAYFLFFRK